MIVVSVLIICFTLLAVQQSYQSHQQSMKAGHSRLDLLEARLSAVERARQAHFDPALFDDLRSKVEALRLSQGLKGR